MLPFAHADWPFRMRRRWQQFGELQVLLIEQVLLFRHDVIAYQRQRMDAVLAFVDHAFENVFRQPGMLVRLILRIHLQILAIALHGRFEPLDSFRHVLAQLFAAHHQPQSMNHDSPPSSDDDGIVRRAAQEAESAYRASVALWATTASADCRSDLRGMMTTLRV